MEDFILYFVAGMIGTEVANHLNQKHTRTPAFFYASAYSLFWMFCLPLLMIIFDVISMPPFHPQFKQLTYATLTGIAVIFATFFLFRFAPFRQIAWFRHWVVQMSLSKQTGEHLSISHQAKIATIIIANLIILSAMMVFYVVCHLFFSIMKECSDFIIIFAIMGGGMGIFMYPIFKLGEKVKRDDAKKYDHTP